MHLYWCADCKTQGCKQRQIFKDVEFHGDESDEPTVRMNFPANWSMRCKACGTIHSYSMKDVDDFQSRETLPLGFDTQL